MGQYMGTGNVADDDAESLVFADEGEWMDEPRPQPCVLTAEGLRWEFDGGAGSASRTRRP